VPEEDGEVEDDHPPECTGLQEPPLVLWIVKEKEVTMRDEEDRTRDLTNEIRSVQKRKKPMRKNKERLQRMKYGSPGHWERRLEKPPNVQLNP